MDPNLIHLDWERTFDALMIVIVLASIVERALALLFENEIYIRNVDRPGLKELIAVVVSIAVCVFWKFDAVSMIVLTGQTDWPGYILTGALIAGGSKASIALFHDLLKVRSGSYERRHEIQADKAAEDAEGYRDEAKRATSPRAAAEAADKARKRARNARRVAVRSGSSEAALAADRAESAAAGAFAVVEKLKASRKPK